MMQTQSRFTFVTTEDGSSTVRILTASGESEAMHSLKGAFSETVYIYGTAIETALSRGFRPTVLSMGLGLGYVEILAAALFCKYGNASSGGGESFEIVAELREWFLAWIHEESGPPAEFRSIYDAILETTAHRLEVSAVDIRTCLRGMLAENRWQIHGEMRSTTAFSTQFGCICFDAFSSKTTPELWTEEFLDGFFAKACAPKCVLSTYACTGALKRSLKRSGFALEIREGFASKRDSTFAVRE